MVDVDHHVAGLLTRHDEAGRLGDIVEGIAAVDHRSIAALQEHRGQPVHVRLAIRRDRDDHAPGAGGW